MSTATVIVACKVPNGVRAQLRAPSRKDDKGNLIAGIVTAEHVFKGPVRALNRSPESFELALKQGDYGITEGVPADFWAEWYANNATGNLVVRGLVFAQEDRESTLAMAREMREVKTGMEPANPDAPGPGLARATKD